MRILMISDVYFPRVNGVSTSISVFRREFARLGHEVTLIAPDYGAPADDEAGVLRIPSRYLFLDPEDRILRLGPLYRQVEALRAGDYDILHIQTPFLAHHAGVRLARQLGLPVVESYHTFFEEYLYCYVPWLPKAWLRAFARRLTRSQCNEVDGVIVPSTAMAEALGRYGVTKPVEILPTGIEQVDFSRGDGLAFRRRHAIDPDRPTLVYVGRVAHEKNIDFLLEVLARIRRDCPEVLLILAGEGPARPHLQRETARLGLTDHVLFVGYLPRDGALQDCYCAGDVFVFASRTETQGLVLLEAMGLGVPVVSTAVMGTRDVLRDGEGALVAEEDVEDFAGKTLRLLHDSALRRQIGEAGRRYLDTWRADRLAERMISYYERLCTAGQPRHENATAASSALHVNRE